MSVNYSQPLVHLHWMRNSAINCDTFITRWQMENATQRHPASRLSLAPATVEHNKQKEKLIFFLDCTYMEKCRRKHTKRLWRRRVSNEMLPSGLENVKKFGLDWDSCSLKNHYDVVMAVSLILIYVLHGITHVHGRLSTAPLRIHKTTDWKDYALRSYIVINLFVI